MKLLKANEVDAGVTEGVLILENTQDPREISLDGISRIDLNFPKFTDGRAFSQAYLLRRRLHFQGEIRATGNVLVDQLQQIQRCGFSSAVLQDGQNWETAQRQLARFSSFYQGDAVHPEPVFSTTNKAC